MLTHLQFEPECSLCRCLTFTGRQRVAPLSFILALQHWLPQQVEAGIAGKLDLGPGGHFHSGGMQVGHRVFQLGAIWRDREWFSVLETDRKTTVALWFKRGKVICSCQL